MPNWLSDWVVLVLRVGPGPAGILYSILGYKCFVWIQKRNPFFYWVSLQSFQSMLFRNLKLGHRSIYCYSFSPEAGRSCRSKNVSGHKKILGVGYVSGYHLHMYTNHPTNQPTIQTETAEGRTDEDPKRMYILYVFTWTCFGTLLLLWFLFWCCFAFVNSIRMGKVCLVSGSRIAIRASARARVVGVGAVAVAGSAQQQLPLPQYMS